MRIAPIFLRYDYGKRDRGNSLELIGFYSALEALGHELTPFCYDDYLERGQRDQLQRDIIDFIDRTQPELAFFILMKDEFELKTLDEIARRCTTVNWFCDDQWRFEDFTSVTAPHFTYSVTTDRFSLSKYRALGYEKVIYSQWAAVSTSPGIDFSSIDHTYDVSFVGGANSYRCWLVSRLRKSGVDVQCFGHGWPNGRLDYADMKDVFQTSRINLNLSNSVSGDISHICSSPRAIKDWLFSRKRIEQIKARNFEIPGSGGFQLTGYVPGLEEYFVIGKEVAAFNEPSDLLLQIGYYLDNESERVAIAEAGYTRSIGEHTYLHRLEQLLASITAGD